MDNVIYENVYHPPKDIFSYMKYHNLYQNFVLLDWFKTLITIFLNHDICSHYNHPIVKHIIMSKSLYTWMKISKQKFLKHLKKNNIEYKEITREDPNFSNNIVLRQEQEEKSWIVLEIKNFKKAIFSININHVIDTYLKLEDLYNEYLVYKVLYMTTNKSNSQNNPIEKQFDNQHIIYIITSVESAMKCIFKIGGTLTSSLYNIVQDNPNWYICKIYKVNNHIDTLHELEKKLLPFENFDKYCTYTIPYKQLCDITEQICKPNSTPLDINNTYAYDVFIPDPIVLNFIKIDSVCGGTTKTTHITCDGGDDIIDLLTNNISSFFIQHNTDATHKKLSKKPSFIRYLQDKIVNNH
jgi:hypothetical protein